MKNSPASSANCIIIAENAQGGCVCVTFAHSHTNMHIDVEGVCVWGATVEKGCAVRRSAALHLGLLRIYKFVWALFKVVFGVIECAYPLKPTSMPVGGCRVFMSTHTHAHRRTYTNKTTHWNAIRSAMNDNPLGAVALFVRARLQRVVVPISYFIVCLNICTGM